MNLKKLLYYIKPNRIAPNKGVVYDPRTIAPCVTDYSGGGKPGANNSAYL